MMPKVPHFRGEEDMTKEEYREVFSNWFTKSCEDLYRDKMPKSKREQRQPSKTPHIKSWPAKSNNPMFTMPNWISRSIDWLNNLIWVGPCITKIEPIEEDDCKAELITRLRHVDGGEISKDDYKRKNLLIQTQRYKNGEWANYKSPYIINHMKQQ